MEDVGECTSIGLLSRTVAVCFKPFEASNSQQSRLTKCSLYNDGAHLIKAEHRSRSLEVIATELELCHGVHCRFKQEVTSGGECMPAQMHAGANKHTTGNRVKTGKLGCLCCCQASTGGGS